MIDRPIRTAIKKIKSLTLYTAIKNLIGKLMYYITDNKSNDIFHFN